MIKNSAIYFLAFALPALLGAVAFSIYTRELTPAEYAVYSVGVSVSFLIGNAAYGWIRFSVGRFQAESPEVNYVPLTLACYGAISLVLVPGTLLVLGLGTSFSFLAGCACLAMTMSQALFDIQQELRKARLESVSFGRASLLRSLVSFALSVAVTFLLHSGAAVLAVTALSFLCFGSVTYLQRQAQVIKRSLDRAFVVRFLRYGTPLALSGFVFASSGTFARAVVGGELGATPAGQFGAALDVTGQVTGILAGSILSAFGPAAIAAFRRGGVKAARHELEQGFELFFGLLLPMTAGLIIVAQPFAGFMAGHEFAREIGKLLPILTISRSLNVFAQFYLHLGFQIVERSVRQVVCGTATLLANVVMCTVLVHFFGLLGGAWALVLADLTGVLVSILLLRPVFPMPMPLDTVLKVTGCTIVMTGACLLVQHALPRGTNPQLFVVAAVGMATYGGCVIVADVAGVRGRAIAIWRTSLSRFHV